jgi:uncharacterized GH25 family protein
MNTLFLLGFYIPDAGWGAQNVKDDINIRIVHEAEGIVHQGRRAGPSVENPFSTRILHKVPDAGWGAQNVKEHINIRQGVKQKASFHKQKDRTI